MHGQAHSSSGPSRCKALLLTTSQDTPCLVHAINLGERERREEGRESHRVQTLEYGVFLVRVMDTGGSGSVDFKELATGILSLK